MPNVETIRESPVFGLARIMREAGYETANPNRERCIIAVSPDENPSAKYTIGILKHNSRRFFTSCMDYIGEIHLKLDASDWNLYVRGRAHVSELTNLAEEITKRMNVKMKVELVSEVPRREYSIHWE